MKELDLRKRIDRRTLNKNIAKGIAAVTFLATVGTYIAVNQPDSDQTPFDESTATPGPEQTSFSQETVTQRVFELLEQVPPSDEDVTKVYAGGEVSILQYVIDGRTLDFYALPCTIEAFNGQAPCDVQMHIDNSIVDTLNEPFINSTIGFSENWYSMTPAGQVITLEYAANTILQTPRFNRHQYKLQSAEATPQGFQNSFLEPIYMARNGIELLQTEPYNTLHKSAGLVPILQKCKQIDPEDIDLKRDFDLIVSPEFRQYITEKGIDLDNLPTIPAEYDDFVYGLESPWVQAVLEWNGLAT